MAYRGHIENGVAVLDESVDLKDGTRVRIEIADTGPGVPKEIINHIFEPFYTTKEEGEGTGLGLSLAYGIVENHGGTITAESVPGNGTTFTIELPISKKDSERHEGGE